MLLFRLLRLRWVILAVVVPLLGRGLEAAGRRLERNRPGLGRALTVTGGELRRRRRGRRRR